MFVITIKSEVPDKWIYRFTAGDIRLND